MTWLGGRHAASLRHRPQSRELDYFPRVWAARALLYAWEPEAEPRVIAALADPSWRVREMAAKVARLRGIAAAQAALERLVSDPVLRVRVAAERALDALVELQLT
ncbi:MAG TPA: HEAT repeat domain-containing protein [Candidatus Dormibacteraeota bacterium]|nr:HEAT repeat domain-containing protein [Candidatus Dormibacteraeota bacterium]